MKAYDLGFGVDPDSLRTNTLYGEPLPGAGAIRSGWTGLWGPVGALSFRRLPAGLGTRWDGPG